jgi:hypothetical protein
MQNPKTWSFTMILNTKFRSLKQTVQSAPLRLSKRVSLRNLRHLLEAAVLKHRFEIVFGLIAISYLIGLLFTLVEFDTQKAVKFHPLYNGITYSDGSHWNGWVSVANFVYGFMEMVARALLFLSVWVAYKYRVSIKIFGVLAIVECADMLDYWIFRNGPWFVMNKFLIFDNWEFEFNYIKIGIVLIFCYSEWKRQRYTGYWG